MLPRSPNRFLFATALLLSVLAAPRAAWANLKLCLKDGSCQMVSSYEVHGDRVRYFSVERSEWEEVPTTLVDFDATKRAQEEAKATEKKQLEEAKQIDAGAILQAPGPGDGGGSWPSPSGGRWNLHRRRTRLVRLVQSSGEPVTDKRRAAMVLAVPLPVVKARSLVVLEGAKAAIRLNDPSPVFYVQSATGLGAKLELMHLKPGKESRVVEDVETSRGKSGKATEERTMVSLARKQVAPNLYTLKPLEPLEAGEYALGELVEDKLSLDVWDFGYEKWEVVK